MEGMHLKRKQKRQCCYRIKNCIQANWSFRYFRKTDKPN